MSAAEGSQIRFLFSVKNGSHTVSEEKNGYITVGNCNSLLETTLLSMDVLETRVLTLSRSDAIDSFADLAAVDAERFLISLTLVKISLVPTTEQELESFLESCVLHEIPCSLPEDNNIAGEYSVLNAMRFADCIYGGQATSTESHSVSTSSRSIDFLRCSLDGSHSYILPQWRADAMKGTFLPDLFKLAEGTDSRLIVVIEGEHLWPEDSSVPSDPGLLTINDVSLNVTVESECVDSAGTCMLTWCRHNANSGRGGNKTLWGEEFDTDFRCAVLRIEGWDSGAAPPPRIWAAIDALFHRAYNEIVTAYEVANILVVDKGNCRDGSNVWGVGDRAATLIAAMTMRGVSTQQPSSESAAESVPGGLPRSPESYPCAIAGEHSSYGETSAATLALAQLAEAANAHQQALSVQKNIAADRLKARLAARKRNKQQLAEAPLPPPRRDETPQEHRGAKRSLMLPPPPPERLIVHDPCTVCIGSNSSCENVICVPRIVVSLLKTSLSLFPTLPQYQMLYRTLLRSAITQTRNC